MRALVPWRFDAPLSSLHDDIDRFFSRFLGEDVREPSTRGPNLVPAVDSFVKNGDLVVRADLPGIEPKDVELSVEDDRLLIKGERNTVHEEKDGGYREVSYGRFERSVRLPRGVDPESIKASYKDGVLEVTVKLPKELEPKKVPISVH